jgi:hypothetical protein
MASSGDIWRRRDSADVYANGDCGDAAAADVDG